MINVPAVFAPLWQRHSRYKGVYGGRGSGKSHDRAAACVIELLKGERVVGIRELQKSIKDSVKQLVEDKIEEMGLTAKFTVTRDEIRHSSSEGLMIFRGMQDHTAESIKSLEGFKIAWVEEAQTLSLRSLRLLTPTIRLPGSELWFTWNPRYPHDAVDRLFRGDFPPKDHTLVRSNWQNNPFFPLDLRKDLERDKENDIEVYEHIWEGGYQRIGEGAYFAQELSRARVQGRICTLPVEREPIIYTGWDLGIDDVTAIWVAQPMGREIHLVDYYENRGYDAKHYADWVIDREYDSGEALLPHDAGYREKGTSLTYEQHLNKAGLKKTLVLPRSVNLLGDIQASRSFLAKCWIDERRCADGLKALGAYRVEMDEKLQTPKLRPVHDWSSHGADALRSLSKLTIPSTSDYDPNIEYDGRDRSSLGYSRRSGMGIDRQFG